jgi:hypothetical protein
MPRVYELPTHLQVEDVLIAGLTARQLLRLSVGASLAYGLWDQAAALPQEPRLLVVAIPGLGGVLLALCQPGGRPLDQWLLAGLLFILLPRRLVWRPGAALRSQPSRDQTGWAELELRPEWLETEPDRRLETSRTVSRRPRAFWRFNRFGSPYGEASQHQHTLRRWFW